jgi:hypothetical protein
VRWIRKQRVRIAGVKASAKRWLGTFLSEFLSGFGSIAILAAVLAYLGIRFTPVDPSAHLFEQLVTVGIGLLVAFSVTLATVERGGGTQEEHLGWLAFGCGLGVAALIGIAACIACTSSDVVANSGDLPTACLAWAAAAFSLLGLVIAIGPLMIHRSRESTDDATSAKPQDKISA